MRLLILQFSDSPRHFWPDANELEESLALALAGGLAEDFRPFLLCRKGSALDFAAQKGGQARLALKSIRDPLGLFALWRWRRKEAALAIMPVGAGALNLATRILAWGGKSFLVPYFPLLAPGDDRKKALKEAAISLCGSGLVLEALEKLLQQPEKTALCQPGMDLEKYGRSSPWQGEGRFVFGMAQSLEPESGAILAVRALAAIWQAGDLPPWELRMFGAGPDFQKVLGEAESLGVASRLAILSEQPLEDVARLCHAWIAPGSSRLELPSTLGAAFAAGIPAICSKTPLHAERVPAADAVLRVAADNPQDLARAMLALMRERRLRERLLKGSGRLRPAFGFGAMLKTISASLESLASGDEKARA